MALGGARPGAGRKKGVTLKPRIADYFTQEQKDALVRRAWEMAQTSEVMLKFLLEQIHGKALQPIGTRDADGNDQPLGVIALPPKV